MMNTTEPIESTAMIPSGGYLKLAARGCQTLSVPVTDADQAVAIWESYRDSNGIGASDMKRGCGNLINAAGVTIAKVSYNGRIWDMDGKRIF